MEKEIILLTFFFLSKFSPFLPIIGTPSVKFSDGIFNIFDFTKKVKFQPIYVGDLVKFLILKHEEKNKIYDLVGPIIKKAFLKFTMLF